jgi:Protein of unknown function (DUF4058)
MPCPFPGMDPFLEVPPYWSDFSPRLLTSISNRLLDIIFPRYDVRLEEYLVLEHDEFPPHRVKPDVVVSTGWKSEPSAVQTNLLPQSAITLEAAYPDFDPLTQRHLVLTHRASGKVVTIMELLSPINQPSNWERRSRCLRTPARRWRDPTRSSGSLPRCIRASLLRPAITV